MHEDVDPDDHGLFSIVVGHGSYESGPVTEFSDIDWTINPLFIRTYIYYGGEWKNMGSDQLQSVPYSMLADNVGNKQTLSLVGSDLSISGGNTVTLPTGGSLWTANGGDIYRPTGNVGIGVSNPIRTLHSVSPSGSNELIMEVADGLADYRKWNYFVTGGTGNPQQSYLRILNDAGTASTINVMTWFSNGNVGIGTISPLSRLDVFASTGPQITSGTWSSMSGSGGGHGLFASNAYVEQTGSLIKFTSTHSTLGASGMAINKPAWHNISFFVNGPPSTKDATITPNYVATISSVGLGVGTTVPQFTLHVKSNGPAIGIESTDHAYIAYYPQSLASGRKAWMGFGGASTTVFSITNENTSGGHILLTPGTGGGVAVGTAAPTGRMVIQTPADWDDNTPLFEVKNKYGTPVLAVYNNGVRINVEHNDFTKSPKGGFSVGGFDYAKGSSTVDLMRVTPDSIRFNINNESAKTAKGGFSVGGFNDSKSTIDHDFLYITPQNSGNGQYNNFMGYMAGFYNTTGINNVFIGTNAGIANTNGNNNVFLGNGTGRYAASNNNTFLGFECGAGESGNYNVYIGDKAGYKTTFPGGKPIIDEASIENVIIGVNAGGHNTGDYCVIIGKEAGPKNEANGQVFVGWGTGIKTTTGEANTFVGGGAGSNNTTGTQNTGVGVGVLYNSTGSYNVGVGSNAGSNITSGSNNIAFGYNAQVPTATSDNQIRMGNTSISYAGIQVSWTVTSDLKWKESIEDLALGLNVVEGLKPVDYIRKNNTLQTREAGFIAQDVEELFKELGIKNAGLLSKGYDGSLELRYNDFIPILTKAIQEQQAQIESQTSTIESQNSRIEKLEKMVGQLLEEKE